ncbi:MAG: hypothetical protein ABJ327_04970 [Litoreibacter sp.]
MKLMILICSFALLTACEAPSFVGDGAIVPATSKAPDHFELPARFAVARIVYGSMQAASVQEAGLWTGVAQRFSNLGSFSPLVASVPRRGYARRDNLIEIDRKQRYNYLLLLRMTPSAGFADVALIDVGSGGVMATVQAVSPSGGRRGFWGQRINNPARLARVTLKIAEATIPSVEEMLRGVAARQN